MDRQIIEISNNGFFLSLYRGFLVIENEKKQKQEIPLDNILSLILSADNTVISKNIVNAVIEQGGNIIFCDKKYLPSTISNLGDCKGYVLPVNFAVRFNNFAFAKYL